ncbi:hypothetical protein DH2020_048472 [Rehmannia glutinosa]|uniref:Uncharacterized protein n=1 Tax=Rehmannia glutinosa TaxID=99300 RepID=A0ABR0U5K2_REHGL
MDRTVSRRSEPSSRTALMGEQPNPWNILQPQVAKSRHRGAKPSRRCSPHLHRHVYFTEPLSETVPRSLRLSCGSPTSLTFRHWAGVSPHTWSYDFAETCVFGKQSPGPGHCDPLCEEAPLLPKLRGYFAEFLRESCLAPLGPDSPSVDEPCGGTLRHAVRALAPPTAWELTVSCSISLPDGGSFHPSLTGAAFTLFRLAARRLYCSPTTPFSRFRLLPFRSPLLRESLLLSFPLATKMFQFARLSLACPWIQQQFERLPYSGISGSMLIFNSPKHFVDYYALPRLWVPREIVHQAVRKGQLDPLPQGSQMRDPGRAADSNYRPCMIHTRSDQLPILPPLRS